jgi:MoxR-like ATPase
MLSYKKVFDPSPTETFEPATSDERAAETALRAVDRRDGSIYVYDEEIILAVNVALTTKRPLLIRGPSGSGKSSLARNIARFFKWRYYEDVISSRTQARDLLWGFDTLRRLSDAQAKVGVKPDVYYIQPGVLWWAFDPESARRRGLSVTDLSRIVPRAETESFLAVDPNKGDAHERAVVLLDEIDKADPDTPNNLLVPLGSLEFFVPEAKAEVKAAHPPLLIITSNDERELSSAFLRRCIMLNLEAPGRTRLVEIARAHFGDEQLNLYQQVAQRMTTREKDTDATDGDARPQPSAAEFLDTVRACLELEVSPQAKDKTWKALSKATLWKPRASTGIVS